MMNVTITMALALSTRAFYCGKGMRTYMFDAVGETHSLKSARGLALRRSKPQIKISSIWQVDDHDHDNILLCKEYSCEGCGSG